MTELDPVSRRSIDLFLARVRQRYRIDEAWLYGSRATGLARLDSDIDLALIIAGDLPLPASSLAAEMGGDTFDVLDQTGRYVAPLPIAASEWRDPARHANPYLLAAIRRDGMAVRW